LPVPLQSMGGAGQLQEALPALPAQVPLGHGVGWVATKQPFWLSEQVTYCVCEVQALPDVAPEQALGGVGHEQLAAPGLPLQVPALQFWALEATTQPFTSVEQVTYWVPEVHTMPLAAP
jgi:hypothetical protein